MVREVDAATITETIARLAIEATHFLPEDVEQAIRGADLVRMAHSSHGNMVQKVIAKLRHLLKPFFIGSSSKDPRRDGIYTNSMRCPVGRQGACECGYGSLGRFIMATVDALDGDRTGNRRNVENRARLSLDHRFADYLAANQCRGQIQIDELLPLFERVIFGADVVTSPAHIVHQRINYGSNG